MAYPHIVLNNDLPFVATTRLPYRLSNYIDHMVVAVDECTLRSDQDIVSNLDVALQKTIKSNSNVVAKNDVFVRGPKPGTGLTMNVLAYFDPWIHEPEQEEVPAVIE